MNRHMLFLSFGIAIGVTPLACSPSPETRQSGEVMLDNADQDRLIVTIWPKITRVQINEPFEVTLRVVNATEKVQSFQVMSCSWDEHWKTNNKRLSWMSWNCPKNLPVTIELEPGQAYEETLQMLVEDGPPLVLTSFQMSFTPIGEQKSYRSNKVSLGIKNERKKGKEKQEGKKDDEKGS